MEWYTTTLHFIQQIFPKLRQTNLALLTYGILKRNTLCPSVIVRAWPLPTTHHHRKKRLWRFLDNKELNTLALSQKLIPQICYAFGLAAKEIPIALDWTPEVGENRCFFAAIAYKRHALPLLCWHLKPEDIGTSQNHLEEALVQRVAQTLPQSATPIFLGDRALGRASFIQFLRHLPQAMGRQVEFVLRLKGEVKIEWGECSVGRCIGSLGPGIGRTR
jgi:hypothetical protein